MVVKICWNTLVQLLDSIAGQGGRTLTTFIEHLIKVKLMYRRALTRHDKHETMLYLTKLNSFTRPNSTVCPRLCDPVQLLSDGLSV